MSGIIAATFCTNFYVPSQALSPNPCAPQGLIGLKGKSYCSLSWCSQEKKGRQLIDFYFFTLIWILVVIKAPILLYMCVSTLNCSETNEVLDLFTQILQEEKLGPKSSSRFPVVIIYILIFLPQLISRKSTFKITLRKIWQE